MSRHNTPEILADLALYQETGSEAAFNRLWGQYEGIPRNLATYMIRKNAGWLPPAYDWDEFYSVASEALMRGFRTYDVTMNRCSLFTYLFTVSKRGVLRVVQRVSRQCVLAPMCNVSGHWLSHDKGYDSVMGRVANVNPVSAEHLDLYDGIERLPVKQRDGIVGFYLEGRMLKDIASDAGVVGWAISMRNKKAMKNLREMLA